MNVGTKETVLFNISFAFLHFCSTLLIKILGISYGSNQNLDLGLDYKSYLCCLQVANKKEKTEWSMEKGYLWQAHIILQEMQESVKKREREVTELLQSERRFNKAMKPQMTVLIFLKSLIKMVRILFLQREKLFNGFSKKLIEEKNATLFIIVIALNMAKCYLVYISLQVRFSE